VEANRVDGRCCTPVLTPGDSTFKDLDKEEDNLIKTRQTIDTLEKQRLLLENEIKALKFNLSSDAAKILETISG